MAGMIRSLGTIITIAECLSFGAHAISTPQRSAAGSHDDISPQVLLELARAAASYVEEGQIVGGELLVRQHGRTLLDEGFGWKDRDRVERMEPGTVFNIRSMTKTMVGVVAEMLIDEGRLAPTDRVSKFLPGFAGRGSREITIDQLLTHRSGLPLSVVTSTTQYGSLYEMGNAIGERGPEFEPGSRFWYSDAGANALGAVVEVVEGAPLADVVARRIVEPLGLESTFAGSEGGDERWPRVAPMYVRAGREWVRAWDPEDGPVYPFVWGSQGMFSTPSDYARFVEMIAAGGQYGEGRILSSRAAAGMAEPVSRKTAMGSDFPEPTNLGGMEVRYGRMLEVRVPAGRGDAEAGPVIGHSGSDGTIIWAWPDRELVIAWFTQSRGSITHLRLERVIDRTILHPGAPIPAVPFEAVEGLLGAYRAEGGPFAGSDLKVVVQDGFLALDVPSVYVSELGPPDATGARKALLIPSVSVSFDLAEDGTARALLWHEPGRTLVFPRRQVEGAQRERPAPDLSDFVGTYRARDDAGMPDVQLVAVEGDLAVVLPGVPEPLRFLPPDAEGYWVLRNNPQMRIRFTQDGEGHVVSFTAFAPDGTRTVRTKMQRPGGDGATDAGPGARMGRSGSQSNSW